MTSPARRHQMRILAAQAASKAAPGGEVQGSAYELMLAQLYEHRKVLKGIQSIERKIEAKREFLPVYEDYLDGALAGGQGGEDKVLTSVMVWHLDVGNFERGLELGAYALAHKLPLPDQYNRDIATLLIDETSTAALGGKLQGMHALEVLEKVGQLTDDHDAPDQARAKLHKAYGYALIGKTATTDPDIADLPLPVATRAMHHLARAHELFDKVGVKKDMERLERRLKAPPGTD